MTKTPTSPVGTAVRFLIALMMGVALLVGNLATSAAADDTTTTATLEELEAAVTAAAANVAEIEGEIAQLESDLFDANAALQLATDDYDAQFAVVTGLEADLADAQEELRVAEEVLTDLQQQQAACASLPSNGEQNRCRGRLNEPIADAQADVLLKDTAVDAAQEELDAAEVELGRLADIVTAADGHVADIEEAIAKKEVELEAAKVVLAEAEAARDAYVAPTEPLHAGCKGLANALTQVQTSSKGKAPTVVAAVSTKLGC